MRIMSLLHICKGRGSKVYLKSFLLFSAILSVWCLLPIVSPAEQEIQKELREQQPRPLPPLPSKLTTNAAPLNETRDKALEASNLGVEANKAQTSPKQDEQDNTAHPPIVSAQPGPRVSRVHKTAEVVNSLKDQLTKILGSLLDQYDSTLLLDIPRHENKGDSAISVGELNSIYSINKPILNYSIEYSGLAQYEALLGKLDPQHTAILAQGGGNIGAWPVCDNYRAKALQTFTAFSYIILSQSVHFFDTQHQAKTRAQYEKHGHVTLMLRDQSSFDKTRKILEPVTPILSPDMAFGIGPVFTFFPPSLDVIWINRVDKERKQISHPKFPAHVKYLVTDWVKFPSPGGKNVFDSSYMKTYTGLLFLQRGKVVVTDRLHGYILATLLDIPTVIIDNKMKKLTNFRNTWTAGKDHAVVATDTQDAVDKAMNFLNTASDRHLAAGL